MKIASAFLLLLLISAQLMSSNASPIGTSVGQDADEAELNVVIAENAKDGTRNLVKRQKLRSPKMGTIYTVTPSIISSVNTTNTTTTTSSN
ncbi:hypothetical protein BKA69DRAFT_1097761 [Paraphysoderma sedebokerense]|nr:hypothetical protein BKA69DRAFT_1097761 [Paraphysoderma sedebokerense]